MLKIQKLTNKKNWDLFLEKKYKGFPAFFQSWSWGEVQKKLGFFVERFGLYENETLVGIMQVVVIHAKRGNYLHLRHGPLLLSQKSSYYKKLFSYLKDFAKEKNCSFLRISPLIEEDEKTKNLIASLGLKNSPIHNMDAEICWVLDITPPEEKLLANMRKSHRYLIKKSLQEEITVTALTEITKDVTDFLDIYKSLAGKRHFVPHRGLLEEIEILGKNGDVVLFVAKYKGKIIGGAVIDFVGDMAVYHHGATDDAFRDLSVSYLLQWHAILEAKKRGKKLYNFWGIASNESKKHPWYGLTLFKTGFGGEKRTFMHAKDLPLSILYWKTYAIDMLTKLKKGY